MTVLLLSSRTYCTYAQGFIRYNKWRHPAQKNGTIRYRFISFSFKKKRKKECRRIDAVNKMKCNVLFLIIGPCLIDRCLGYGRTHQQRDRFFGLICHQIVHR